MPFEKLEQAFRRTACNFAPRFFAQQGEIQLDPMKKTDGQVFRLLNKKTQVVAGIQLGSVQPDQRRSVPVNRVGHKSQPLFAQLVPKRLLRGFALTYASRLGSR